MMNISMVVTTKTKLKLYASVFDEDWEKYQNGEITADVLYDCSDLDDLRRQLEFEVIDVRGVKERENDEI